MGHYVNGDYFSQNLVKIRENTKKGSQENPGSLDFIDESPEARTRDNWIKSPEKHVFEKTA